MHAMGGNAGRLPRPPRFPLSLSLSLSIYLSPHLSSPPSLSSSLSCLSCVVRISPRYGIVSVSLTEEHEQGMTVWTRLSPFPPLSTRGTYPE
ncbi:hypothetical protein LX32DRAFT_327916 [Colletotrichum zoysiae]|uniref:Uncharacterized protein n=1 Tax=Colletotrichum zoysiae TaxID=1216348 RepID=A0AAD9HL67_9PEZI|nr:hypothetical protein LX32DRAFT_327916 [Colletotrichum zoysiae]